MTPQPPTPLAPSPFRHVGFWALVAAALGLLIVLIGIGLPMMDPKPSVGTQIGEIAGEMRRAAWRGFFGLAAPEPEPVPTGTQWQSILAMFGPALGALAVILGVVSGVKGENWRYAAYAGTLGIMAIVFQFFWWVALLITGVIIIVAILDNIGDIFGGIFS